MEVVAGLGCGDIVNDDKSPKALDVVGVGDVRGGLVIGVRVVEGLGA